MIKCPKVSGNIDYSIAYYVNEFSKIKRDDIIVLSELNLGYTLQHSHRCFDR